MTIADLLHRIHTRCHQKALRPETFFFLHHFITTPLTARQISQATTLTPDGARIKCLDLEKQGLLTTTTPLTTPARPNQKTYTLTPEATTLIKHILTP